VKDQREDLSASTIPDGQDCAGQTTPASPAQPGLQSGSTARRLIVVSNRLPFTIREADGQLQFTEATGGLVTGMKSYLEGAAKTSMSSLWVGWPGSTLAPEVQAAARERALAEAQALPVFLTAEAMEQFYHGFCNKTIWPLFHYFPVYTTYAEEHWEEYRRVNQQFCDVLAETARAGDVIWVHDYHLMLLPALLRDRLPDVSIGFFLHIPFPSFEIFRLIPGRWRKAILEGLLGADLIGFHTYEYCQHFLQSVLRILGHEHQMGRLVLPSHVVHCKTFPMGIDYARFSTGAADPDVESERRKLRTEIGDRRLILSVDRLDYTKGILNRLQAFEHLLKTAPAYRNTIVLILIVVPSRIGVDQYEVMKKQIEETVGRINGRFGTIGWTPVIYQYRYLSFAPLVALYRESDVTLVTPLRDGMNLIAKEYIATRSGGNGVLILSEMAGAAKELGESIIINPNDRIELADAMREALDMPNDEQLRRNQIMQERLRRYDIHRWAHDFLTELEGMRDIQQRYYAKVIPQAALEKLRLAYHDAHSRLLLLDYDGTLVPFARRPQQARPGQALITLLSRLAAHPGTDLVIISGRQRAVLDAWFGELPIGLVAEHGFWIREAGHEWSEVQHRTSVWKSELHPILQLYADRLPGAFVEEKEHSLVWHCRAADPEQARVIESELADHIMTFTANIDVQVLRGAKVVEIRNAGVNKGIAARRWMMNAAYDFVFAAGDDWTDEDLFAALPDDATTVRVGITNTQARFNLKDHHEVLRLLHSLSA
jgi:trehalose 6-phosphate synthase/phosphatase